MGEEFRNQSSAGTSHRYAAIRPIASDDSSYGNPAATQIAMSNQNLGKTWCPAIWSNQFESTDLLHACFQPVCILPIYKYEYLYFRASSVSPSFQSRLGFQAATIRYMQAPFQYLSIATQPSNHFSPHTCHTYYSSQVRMNHQNEHVHHVSETPLAPETDQRKYITPWHLILAGLLSIQTIQHALYQFSLALF